MMRLLFAVFSLLWLFHAHAEDGVAVDPRVAVRTVEPEREVGYTVGDTLTRTVILEAKRPYQLLKTSLPIAGNDQKRRGKGSGIEVREVTVDERPGLGSTVYTLTLTYQVFTNNIVAKPAALPAEFVKFGGNNENFEVRIPSWSFRISPLAVYGSVVVERDMSTFRGPLLLDPGQPRQLLWGLLAVAGLALLGLFYVLGTTRWLPRMGGPFARAGRDLRKLARRQDALEPAVRRVHEALNASSGRVVFDSAGFVAARPAYAGLREEIDRFFALSRTVFFEPGAAHGIEGDPLAWLRGFCRRCRDFERGLK